MSLRKMFQAAAAALIVALAGCANNPYQDTAASYPEASTIAYGTVESIEVAEAASGGPGLGAIAGAAAGGLLGHQVGSGRGNTAATIGGAIAGGIAGNEIEKRTTNRAATYRVRVRLDNGAVRVLNQDTATNLRVGSRVRVENGRAYPI